MKLKINYLTYLYLLLVLISGLFKNAVALIIIIVFHELGHIIIIKLLKYPIKEINIYPFGGIILIDKVINTKISHDILIGMGGILGELILWIIMLFIKPYLTPYFYSLVVNYNIAIIILNSMPIYPFDGYHVINNVINYCFSFEKSYQISLLINLISNIAAIILFIKYHYLNIPFLFILFYSLAILINQRKVILSKFYMERLYYDFYYRKTNYLKYNHKKYLKREVLSYYISNNHILNEKDIIRKKGA